MCFRNIIQSFLLLQNELRGKDMRCNLVSIIVPIYKVEKYIKSCVESLLSQDYENIEVILVDDGSPDSSPEIIDTLALKDERIKVIHKKNEGVSSARNTGIDVAKGEYIMFVDGDDWVDDNYVSYFVGLVEDSRCDIGMNKSNYSIVDSVSTKKRYTVTAEKAIEWIYLGDLFVAVWNKIYKANLFRDFKIRFNKDIWYGEGMLFNIECLQCVDTVAIGENNVYHQTFNPDSAMRSFNLKSNFCGIRSMDLQKDLWKKQNKAIDEAWKYHRYCFNRSIIDGLVRSDSVSSNYEVFDDCVHNLRKDIRIPLKIEKSPRKIAGWLAYFVNPMFMARRAARKFYDTMNSLGK